MNHRPASSQQRPPGHGTPRSRRMLAALGGLAVFLTAAIGLAPAASATLPPPEPSLAPAPPPPPTSTAPAGIPLGTVIAILALTIILSVATTLVTLSLETLRRARRPSAPTTRSPASAQTPFTTPAPEAGQAEILSSHPVRDRSQDPFTPHA